MSAPYLTEAQVDVLQRAAARRVTYARYIKLSPSERAGLHTFLSLSLTGNHLHITDAGRRALRGVLWLRGES